MSQRVCDVWVRHSERVILAILAEHPYSPERKWVRLVGRSDIAAPDVTQSDFTFLVRAIKINCSLSKAVHG